MVENYLLIPMKNVKKQTPLGPLCVVLAGCDDAKGLVSLMPEMASFSSELDFDPLRGPVKDFSQTSLNDKDGATKRVAGTLSQEGCFDTPELHDIENNTDMALILDANYYRDVETLEKRIHLQGKRQLAELPAVGVVWDTDDSGFAVSATGKEMKMQYRYDAEDYPPGKTIVSKDNTLQVDAKPPVNPLKKLDYTAVSLFNNHPLGNVKQTCEYDEYVNPVNCQLAIVDESVKPAVEHHHPIESIIDYY